MCAQLCLTVCNPVNFIPLGSYVHGISQARILEWVAMPSSRESFYSGNLSTERRTEPESPVSPALAV